MSQGHLLVDKVGVNLNMLRALVVDWVGCHIDNAHIVTVDNRRRGKRDMKLLKKLAKPATLGRSMGHSTILHLGARTGDGGLMLGGPRDRIVAEEDAEPQVECRESRQPAQFASKYTVRD